MEAVYLQDSIMSEPRKSQAENISDCENLRSYSYYLCSYPAKVNGVNTEFFNSIDTFLIVQLLSVMFCGIL